MPAKQGMRRSVLMRGTVVVGNGLAPFRFDVVDDRVGNGLAPFRFNVLDDRVGNGLAPFRFDEGVVVVTNGLLTFRSLNFAEGVKPLPYERRFAGIVILLWGTVSCARKAGYAPFRPYFWICFI